jgi:HSP20 family protein
MTEITVQKAANPEDRRLPVFNEVERMMERIRERAFAAFAQRNFAHGSALSDWLAAERELCWPASELVEHEQDYALSVAIAGFRPKDITVTATPRELIVSAKTQTQAGDQSKDGAASLCWSEFRRSDVYRRIELPSEIQVDKVVAQYDNGMLKVIAPKNRQPAKGVAVAAAA